jgi:hypothetical protein
MYIHFSIQEEGIIEHANKETCHVCTLIVMSVDS